MDTFFEYNQIKMHLADKKIPFITKSGLYCYKIMPFGLKSTKATYEWLGLEMGGAGPGRAIYKHDLTKFQASDQA